MQVMKKIGILLGCCLLVTPAFAANKVPPAPNGIEFPAGYQDWRESGCFLLSAKHFFRLSWSTAEVTTAESRFLAR